MRISGELYAIPLEAVSESVRVDPVQILGGPSGELLVHRDREVPVIRAAEFLELERPARSGQRLPVVLLSVAGRDVGLVVDELLGEQEIVVKPLSEFVAPIVGIAGGTILGDGAIALILDPIALVAHVHKGRGSIVISGALRPR